MSAIEVRIPTTFVAERSYALSVLLGEFLGLRHVIVPVEGLEDYHLIPAEGRCLTVRDHFFGRFADVTAWLHPGNIPAAAPAVRVPFAPEGEIPLLFGEGILTVGEHAIDCGLDLFAAAFFMLTRWEEHADGTRDRHGRFPAEASLAVRAGFLHRPVVDEYTEMLWGMLRHLGCPQERRVRRFALAVTHDVDIPLRWNLRRALKICAGDLALRRSPRLAVENAASYLLTRSGLQRDPFDTFDTLMDLSEEIGVVSRFYFMAGGDSPHDPGDYLHRPFIRRLFSRIRERGHEIGFHPSYNACTDGEMWRRELAALSAAAGEPVRGGREHYLRFDVPATWQLWEDNGMAYDSTLGYAEQPGFRCGTCHDYPVFNILTHRVLRLRELPLIAMDTTLVLYKGLAPEAALESLTALLATVARYGGTFVLLWHNSNLAVHPWKPYAGVYREFLWRAGALLPRPDRSSE